LFSVARQPLNFDQNNVMKISAILDNRQTGL
jgi:hypothetical protein